MAQIKITRTTFVAGDLVVEGKTVDVAAATARQLVRMGKAEFVDPPKKPAGKRSGKANAGSNAGKDDDKTNAGGDAGGSQG